MFWGMLKSLKFEKYSFREVTVSWKIIGSKYLVQSEKLGSLAAL